MLKIIGSLFQVFGLLYFLVFSIGASALGLHTLLTGKTSALTELGNILTVLSFFGAVPLVLLIIGSGLVKKVMINSYFPNGIFELIGKIVIIPICIALSVSFAVAMVPFFAYRYYQYRKGVMTNTVRFVKWAAKGWTVTLPLYVTLVYLLFTLI